MPRTPRKKETKKPVIIEDVKEPEPEDETETEQPPSNDAYYYSKDKTPEPEPVEEEEVELEIPKKRRVFEHLKRLLPILACVVRLIINF